MRPPDDGVYCYEAAGKVRSQGIDLELIGALTPDWQIGAGYTFAQAKYRKDADHNKEGRLFDTDVPRHLFKLNTVYTLPGIAGIVLTMGMAVDANVLIFSRIREEIANGLTPQRAINEGFNRAFTAIVDSNLTTLLVGGILFAMGTGPVSLELTHRTTRDSELQP